MHTDRREHIRRSLTSLADSYAATLAVMEQTVALLCEELSLGPPARFPARTSPPATPTTSRACPAGPSTCTGRPAPRRK